MSIEQKTVEILDKLDALATQYTPEVIDGAIAAVSITAIGNLIMGLVSLGCAFIAWWLATNFTKYARNKKDQGGYMSDWEFGIGIGMSAGVLVTVIVALSGIWALFDIWNWVAIWNPKLALAHRILDCNQ